MDKQDFPGEAWRKERRFDSEKALHEVHLERSGMHHRFVLNLGISSRSDTIYWLLKMPCSHSGTPRYIDNCRPELWAGTALDNGTSKQSSLLKVLRWKHFNSTVKSGFFHRPVFLNPSRFRVLSLSREFPFLIYSPEIHHTLWMSLGLLRSTIST